MKSEFCAITSKGLESACSDEIASKFGCKITEAKGGCVFFLFEGEQEKLYENLRSVHFLFQVISRGEKFTLTKDAASLIGKTMLVRAIPNNSPLEAEVGGVVFGEMAAMGNPVKVEFKKPETLLRCLRLGDELIVGIDWGKAKLSNRLRVFTTRFSLNPVSAYALASSCRRNSAFLATNDCWEAIEAAIMGLKVTVLPVNEIISRGVRQNATVAGVIDNIGILESNWELALKLLPDSSLDSVGAQFNFEHDANGHSSSLFFKKLSIGAKGKLISGGRLNIITASQNKPKFKELAECYVLESSTEFMQGELALTLMSFKTSY